jgi:uridine kinase
LKVAGASRRLYEIFGTVSHAPVVIYDDLCARVSGLMTSMDRAPVIGISGHGGAGKSTLADRLMTDLGGSPEQVIRTDSFHAVGAGPCSGLFDLHDWPALFDLLHRLRAAKDPKRLSYTVRTYSGAERSCDVPMPPVVLVEGIRLLRPETMTFLDMAVWIDMAPEAAGRRAVERNRHQGDSSDELDLWRTKWIPEAHEYAQLVCPEQLAHVVVRAAGPDLPR